MARILLVDDDHELLNMAAALLRHSPNARFEVVCCENAMEAIEHARKSEFDVVITDANMSPHTGYDLIRSLKLIPGFDLIPIAMLTGRREKRDVERALAVGAQDYIVKPLDPDHFVKKVIELVHRSEEHRRAIRYAEITLDEVGSCDVPLVIIGMNESGVLLDSDHHLHLGSIVRLDAEVFNRVGIPKPQVRVASCTPGSTDGTFEIRTTFHDFDEKSSMKVRQYVAQTTQKRNAKAS